MNDVNGQEKDVNGQEPIENHFLYHVIPVKAPDKSRSLQ